MEKRKWRRRRVLEVKLRATMRAAVTPEQTPPNTDEPQRTEWNTQQTPTTAVPWARRGCVYCGINN